MAIGPAVHALMVLVVVPSPAENAMFMVALDPFISCTLLDADKVRMLGEFVNDLGRNVLSRATGDVVDNAGAAV